MKPSNVERIEQWADDLVNTIKTSRSMEEKTTNEFTVFMANIVNLLNQALPYVTDPVLHANIDSALKNPPSPGVVRFQLMPSAPSPVVKAE